MPTTDDPPIDSPGETPSEQRSTLGRHGAYAKGVARRAEILDRAIEVFRERGAAGTSLRRIAEALGVSHGALLHYFDSREQLLIAVYEHHERTRARTAPASADDAGTAESMVGWASANAEVPGLVELYTTLLAGSLGAADTVGREFFTERFDRVRAAAATRLRREQAEGRIRDDVDPDAIAALIIAASDGLQVQWLLDPSIDLERTFAAFGTLLARPTDV